MKRLLLVLSLAGFSLCAVAAVTLAAEPAGLPVTKATPGAEVYIISPKNGATVHGKVTVRFGLKGMGVAPAGVAKVNTGHHHLLVDVKQLPPAGLPIPADAQHIHFGGGQTETTVALKPGTHTLQLELADANHIPFDPAVVSQRITVHVE
jgi:hypothetical protein